MKKEMVNKIMEKVIAGWLKRIPKGATINQEQLKSMMRFLLICPDDDGFKRVKSTVTGKTHLVPYEDIMLNGLHHDDLEKYPVEELKNGMGK